MAYVVYERNQKFGPRKDLEGPFQYPNGRVLYYDATEGKYYDPLTDYYVDHDEVHLLQTQIYDILAKTA